MRFWVEIIEGIKISLTAIRNHKMRSLLTTLGIIIGIVSVTAMFTVINGIERGFDRSVALLGNDVLHIDKWPWADPGAEWWEMMNRREIDEDLLEFVQKRVNFATAISPNLSAMAEIKYGNKTINQGFMQGGTVDFIETGNVKLTDGRYFTDQEDRSYRQVVILGKEVAETLFPTEQAIGKVIRLNGNPFTVVGILDKQGKFLGLISFDNQVQIPYHTFKKLFGTQGMSIQVKVPEAQMDVLQDELRGIVRIGRKLSADEKDDFVINKQQAFRAQFDGIKAVIYTVGIFLTALSLLVGGIGVMNIMFVSVKERTREIGIRKAIGAPRRAILFQFLVEAVAVCMLGGCIGIVISFGVTAVINSFFTAVLSPATVGLAFGICVGIGLVFGFIPAWTAARQNPIEALRYE